MVDKMSNYRHLGFSLQLSSYRASKVGGFFMCSQNLNNANNTYLREFYKNITSPRCNINDVSSKQRLVY